MRFLGLLLSVAAAISSAEEVREDQGDALVLNFAPSSAEEVHDGLQLPLGAGGSCDARYTTPCARTNSRWLAEKVGAALEDAANDPDEFQIVLDSITGKNLNRNSGFYPFVFDQDGICVAHGSHAEFVGTSIKEIFDTVHLAFADPAALHERFMASNADWVSYLWTDEGSEAYVKLAYIINNITDVSNGRSYYVGVGFQDQPLPADLPCSHLFDRWCSLTNVRRLVGRAQFELEQANTIVEFESIVYRISFDDNQYKIPDGFYLFMYTFDGEMKAHGILRDDSFGKNLWDYAAENDIMPIEEGLALHETFQNAVSSNEHPEAWVQYPWRNSLEEDPIAKVALLVEVEFNNELYYIGAGFRLSGMDSIESDTHLGGEVCSDQYNLPCSFTTAYQLSSHAMAYAISSFDHTDEIFKAISRNSEFKHGDFYLFVYGLDDDRCMAHGGNEDFVGKTLAEIFEDVGIPVNGTELYGQFRIVSEQGGGWVLYNWVDLARRGMSNFNKISYIFQLTIDGHDYFGGIGFNHLRYPLDEHMRNGMKQNGEPIPCSREFGLVCSENNARAILGQALAELVLSSSEASAVQFVGLNRQRRTHDVILREISKRDPNFSINDFSVGVFSFDRNGACSSNATTGCAVAYGSNSKYVGMTWNEIHAADNAVTIPGDLLHQKLIDASNSGSGVFTYPYGGNNKRAWVAQFKHDGENYYVVADYLTAEIGPTCLNSNGTNGCPSGMECTDADQSFCKPTDEFPVWISAVIGTFAVLLVGSIGGYLYVNQKRKEEARERKVLASKMTEMEKIIEARKNIDNEISDLDEAFGDVKRKRHSLIMKRAALLGRPSTWTTSCDILVPVNPEDEEYWCVLESLRVTMSDVHIAKLWRVQNESLWSYYSFHKDRLEDNNIDPNERRVWHGTSSMDPHIVYSDKLDGFMMQFAANGLWGRGIYFADKASYSKNYSHKPAVCETSKRERPGTKEDELEMFLTRLSVGKEVKLAQDRNITIPPIDWTTGNRFNSVTGVTADSQVWIVYENGRAYPEYLVRYYIGPRDKSRTPYKSKDSARKSLRWSGSNSFQRELSTSSHPDVSPTPRQGSWEYLSDNGWVAYDSTNQALIENTFQNHTQSAMKPTVIISGPQWKYEVNVKTMVQKNIQHVDSRERGIRFHSNLP